MSPVSQRVISRRVPVDATPNAWASRLEAYAHLLRMLCDPGDRVLVPSPSYPLLEPLAALEGVRLGAFPLTLADRWRLDLAALERAADARTRAIVLVQPNHPTGSCLTP